MNKFLKFKQEQIKVDHIVSELMRYMIIVLALIWILDVVGLFQYDLTLMTIYFCLCGLLMLTPTLLVDTLHLQKTWVSYVNLACTVGVVGLLNSLLSYHFSAFFVFPLFIASLYNTKKFVLFSSIIDLIVIVITSILTVVMGLAQDETIVSMLTQFVLPNVLIIIAFSVVAFFIVSENNRKLMDMIEQSNKLKENQESLIFALAEMSENKSRVTGEHIKRVASYMKILGDAAGFTMEYAENLATAAMLHDVGKLMIPEEILDKPARLTDEEFAIMKNHVLYGEALLANTKGDIMEIARVICLQHHEKWDGSGYLGLKGEQIAYISRLMAVCDVWDALTSKRNYKEGWDLDEAYAEIVRLSGSSFDPDVVDLFVKNYDKFQEVWANTPDKKVH